MNPGWLFDGNWRTTIPGQMSQILVKKAVKRFVEMGPLWNNDEAQAKGKLWQASNPGWRFTGGWRTTIPGQMSEIEVEKWIPAKKEVEVGPSWNNDDAKAKAEQWISANPGWRFTGGWKTTIPGQMSVVEVEQI